MARKLGDWTKVTGGDHGVYWDGRRWVVFDCLYCAKVRGLLVRRLQLADVRVAHRALRERSHVVGCDGAAAHREYYKMKAEGKA